MTDVLLHLSGVLLGSRSVVSRALFEIVRGGCHIVHCRPGGMERPADDYKKTHNLVIKPRDSIFGGQVGVVELYGQCDRCICESVTTRE